MIRKIRLIAVVMIALFAGSALAAVSAEEAKQLGMPGSDAKLTPMGSPYAGNADGTIPGWDNQGVKPPASYDRAKAGGHRPNPWPNEKPLFIITAQNVAQYQDKITEAEVAMLKKFPDFKMVVYPAHRADRYPDYYLENSIKNATQCKLKGEELDNCLPGVPFPIPKNGLEAYWNHSLGMQHIHSWGDSSGWLVDVSGNALSVGSNTTRSIFPMYRAQNKDKILEPGKTVRWRYRQAAFSPAREAGSQIVIIDTVGTVGSRRAWLYIPGQRRVKLAPDLSFDTPLPQGGSAATFDDVYTFFGSPERYTWKLLGTKEVFLWANSYGMTDPKDACGGIRKIVRKNFPNPDCIRYELRRVWVVEANLKQGYRHIYPRRIFYWDMDNANRVGTSVNYDAAGIIYRIAHSNMNAGYNLPGPPEQSYGGQSHWMTIDLNNGTWLTSGSEADTDVGWALGDPSSGPVPDSYFSPEAVAAEGVR